MLSGMSAQLRAAGLDLNSHDKCWQFFLSEVKTHLRVVLCFSPGSPEFRRRLRRLPALLNCTAVDWFQPWPMDALLSVSEKFLEDLNLDIDKSGEIDEEEEQTHRAIIEFMPFAFQNLQQVPLTPAVPMASPWRPHGVPMASTCCPHAVPMPSACPPHPPPIPIVPPLQVAAEYCSYRGGLQVFTTPMPPSSLPPHSPHQPYPRLLSSLLPLLLSYPPLLPSSSLTLLTSTTPTERVKWQGFGTPHPHTSSPSLTHTHHHRKG